MRLPDEKGVLNVTVVVTRVAEIKIVGNHKTRRNVILRAMNTKVNDYLNVFTLDRDRINLINLDLFEPGGVNPSDYPLGAGRVGITVNVVEKRTGTVTAGVGYSNRAQLIGFAEIVETNFRGMGESINLRGEVGGAAGTPQHRNRIHGAVPGSQAHRIECTTLRQNGIPFLQ